MFVSQKHDAIEVVYIIMYNTENEMSESVCSALHSLAHYNEFISIVSTKHETEYNFQNLSRISECFACLVSCAFIYLLFFCCCLFVFISLFILLMDIFVMFYGQMRERPPVNV